MTPQDAAQRPPDALLCPDCGHHLHRPNPGQCGWRDCKCGLTPPQDAAQEARIREALWRGHGHDFIYGDDGEMQCNWTEHPTDFKRATMNRLLEHCDLARLMLVPAAPAAEGLREAVIEAARQVHQSQQESADTNPPGVLGPAGQMLTGWVAAEPLADLLDATYELLRVEQGAPPRLAAASPPAALDDPALKHSCKWHPNGCPTNRGYFASEQMPQDAAYAQEDSK